MAPLLLLALAAFMVSPRSLKKDMADNAKRLSNEWTHDLGDLLRHTPICCRFSAAVGRIVGINTSVFENNREK